MKKVNEYVLIANNETEYDKFNNNQLHDYFDIMCLLKIFKEKSFQNLDDLIVNKIEIFDKHNAVIDFKKIKKAFGIKGNFANYPKGAKLKSFDLNSVTFDQNVISKSPAEMDPICQIIFEKVYDGFLKLFGPMNL
jgi:hypothetical protein